MQYPALSRSREYRVTIPTLNGGVNVSVPPGMVSDNQLTSTRNVWYRHGCLQTRPALKAVQRLQHESGVQYRFGSVGDNGCILGISNGYNYASLIQKDGGVVPHRTSNDGKVYSMLAVPVDSEHLSAEATADMLLFMYGESEYNTGVFALTDSNDGRERLTPYVPTVLMNGRPQATMLSSIRGDHLEPYNMLTDEFICTYTPGGEGLYYILPESSVIVDLTITFPTDNSVETKTLTLSENFKMDAETGLYFSNGISASGYIPVYNKDLNCFYFCEVPAMDSSAPSYTTPVSMREVGDNTITVHLRRTDTEAAKASRNTILGMRFSTWFGGFEGLSNGTRLFVSGNPDHPNLVHWSALNNPLYFPENNCVLVGEDTNAVTAFGKQSDMLVVFKERELYYTTYSQGSTVTADEIETQTVVDVEASAAVFPFRQLHSEIGCDCPGTILLCNNRLVWLNSNGKVYGLFSAGIYSERNLRVLSLQIETELRKYTVDELRAATATRFEEQYLLLIDGDILAMDYSSYGFNYYGSFSSDEKAQKNVTWHLWDFDTPLIAALRVGESAVLVGAKNKEDPYDLYTYTLDENGTTDAHPFNDGTGVIVSSFATKLYDFGAMERRKRIHAMYLHMSGTEGATVCLDYLSGAAAYEKQDFLRLTGEPLEAVSPYRRTPNMLRVRQFGFRLSCEGRISVGGFVLNYSMMGVCGK